MSEDSAKSGNIIELVLVIDRSGSMGGMESDTIGGINAVLNRHRKLGNRTTVSTVLFDDCTQVLHDRLPLEDVPQLTEDDYHVRGCTALLDALGGSVRHIERVQGYMPAEYKADKVIFVITTDGLENASRNYTYPQVKRTIERKQEEGWEFLFLGANIDATAEASRMGIGADRAATYLCDQAGTTLMFDAVADATCCMSAQPTGRIGGLWHERIDRDTAKRGRKRR